MLALAAAPVARTASADAVRIGVATESFHDLPRIPGQDNVDDIIRALKASGATGIDLASANTEAPSPDTGLPPPPPPGPYGGPPAGFTPAELAARNRALRDNLRKWRLATPASHYTEIGARFQAAGRHGVPVTFRNGSGWLETPAQLARAAALSKQFRVNLDIGNFTAANQESVAYIQENHEKITHLIVKDRTRNNGGNEAFGAGDTPIKPVLALLRDRKFPIRVCVDYEYVGLGTPQEEVRKCLAYVRAALA